MQDRRHYVPRALIVVSTLKSGIHGLDPEDELDNLTELKSVKKTRKQQKENCASPVTDKKRKNYVRYPSEENIAFSLNVKSENIAKSSRKSRRNTLKEQNLLITDSETSNDERKPVRLTRRTKKFDIDDGSENVPSNIENNDRIAAKRKGKKKKTKKSSIENENIEEPIIEALAATKKKSNKKKTKKRSNSIVVEDILPEHNKSLNKSNGSIDSFHSAAGSPVKFNQECFNNFEAKTNQSPNDKKSKINTIEKEKSNHNLVEKGGKRKQKLKSEKVELPANSPIRQSLTNEIVNKTENIVLKQSEIDNTTFEKEKDTSVLSNTFETVSKNISSGRVSICNDNEDILATGLNSTYEMKNVSNKTSSSKKRKSSTLDKSSLNGTKLNATYDTETANELNLNKSDVKETSISNLNLSAAKSKRKSSIVNSTFDKIENSSVINLDATFEKTQNNSSNHNTEIENRSSRSSKHSLGQVSSLNNTYDKNTNNVTVSLDATFDKIEKMNDTFDKNTTQKSNSTFEKPAVKRKSSIISSDTTDSRSDLTDDNSRISITSDESKENIVNTTPVLIESSLDESQMNGFTENIQSPKQQSAVKIQTPLKREGTFNKDMTTTPLKREGTYTELKPTTPVREDTFTKTSTTPLNRENTFTDTKTVSEPNENVENKEVTPLKREGTFTKDSDSYSSPEQNDKVRRKSLPSPGHTPFPLSRSTSKDKNMLNITRSIEKRRSSLRDVAPRTTKVMFCSPVNNPAIVTQMKGKVIKSNLKGSNKSFVFDESVSEITRPARKRSYTQSEADEVRSKRKRLTEDQQHSVERLSRPRTASASARLQDPGTPSKKVTTPSKAKPEKVSRTKLPNFAALHQKQFEKMESLDECQERKAKRARQLLTPTAPINVLERISPKEQHSQQVEVSKKPETPKKHEFNPGYSRFGFKLNLDVNPFSFPKNTEIKLRNKPKVLNLKRQATLPSLTGATNLRKNIAKQTIMREKSFTDKRNVDRKENRTVIKGVRTNRRFELQMKMRNINEK
ncbi:unnamed protein product, partial [Brenthis ino]